MKKEIIGWFGSSVEEEDQPSPPSAVQPFSTLIEALAGNGIKDDALKGYIEALVASCEYEYKRGRGYHPKLNYALMLYISAASTMQSIGAMKFARDLAVYFTGSDPGVSGLNDACKNGTVPDVFWREDGKIEFFDSGEKLEASS